jgi:signal transduction histidine kinase/CheY-like chemotaxis protein
MNVVLEARVRERTAELETEARRRADAESRLHQAQKMEAVGQLTGGIAHDFNNILQVILGNLQIATIMLRRAEGGLPQRPSLDMLANAIETAQKSARSAGQLVHRLLAFSRRQTLEPEVLDANQLIAGMEDMMARTLGETIELRTSLAPGLWNTFADRNQLETALLNLVVNARDAMPDGGRVTIETSNARIDGVSTPGDLKPGEYVELVVRDTGEGIPADILDKVFDPFFTTKDTGKGSGLGLSMVYGFVQQSGGRVRIESAVGRGCTVRIHLPRANAHPQPSPAPASGPSAALARARDGETVLLVEDNADVRRFATTALEGLGYRVLQAADARSALDQLDARPGGTLHLLFTDVVLPGGVSGRALADAVCARQPGLPVLFTSGYTGRTALDPGPLVQDVHVLAKPYAIEDLAARVRDALDRAAPAAPNDRF